MSRVLKVDQSDYRLRVQTGGNIILDTGPQVGVVTITGDLKVLGETTTIDTTNLNIEDNIILLNKGELGAGVTEVVSGLEVDRGSLLNSQIVFDESATFWDPTSQLIDKNVEGAFIFRLIDESLVGIRAASIAGDPNADFAFDLQYGPGALIVTNSDFVEGGSVPYELRLTNPNSIPNLKWVYNYVAAGGYDQGMADVDKIYFRNPFTLSIDSRAQAFPDRLEFFIQESTAAKISAIGLDVDEVNIKDFTIRSTGENDLVLFSAVTDHVVVDGVLSLTDISYNPALIAGTTKIYSRSNLNQLSQTPGRTGLFFVNTVNPLNEDEPEELVSKNRALLFSMLF